MIYKKLKEFIRKARLRQKAYSQNKPEATYRLSCNSVSLTVHKDDIFGNHDESSIDWEQIKYAFVYTEDCFAVDRICMYLGKSPESGFLIHEEMENWNELINELPKYLPGAKDMGAWWSEVVFPAFATNLTLVYKDPSYPDSEIQKMMEGETDKGSKPSRCLKDISLYLCSFLPWVLCFYSRVANDRHINRILIEILFWLGIILILPSIIILAKAVTRFLSWVEFSESSTVANSVFETLVFILYFCVPILLYAIAMIVSLSVF